MGKKYSKILEKKNKEGFRQVVFPSFKFFLLVQTIHFFNKYIFVSFISMNDKVKKQTEQNKTLCKERKGRGQIFRGTRLPFPEKTFP